MFANVYAGRRVLVTGHSGFKGSWLSFWLVQLGAQVTGYSAFLPSTPANYDVLRLSQQVTAVEGDVRDFDALRATADKAATEIVFHLAAQPIVRRALAEPKLTFETNAGGTLNVLEVLRQRPQIKAAVLVTSDKCYENVEWEYGYRETDRLGGKEAYSASKACAELVFAAYWHSFFTQGGPQVASARAGNVIGGGDWAADRIVPDCVRAWADGKPALLRHPESTRPWQHVLDPISAYLWLGAKLFLGGDNLGGKAYNFGPASEEVRSVGELVRTMSRHWPGAAWACESDRPSQKREAGLLKLCCDRALRDLGWRSVLAIDEALALTAEWYRQYYQGGTEMTQLTQEQIGTYVDAARRQNLEWATSKP